MEIALSNDMSGVPIKNFVKIKALLYLKRCYDAALKGETSGAYAWCSIPDIASCTGSQPDSLRSILKRWELNGWYVDARRFGYDQMSDNREHTLYIAGDTMRCWYSRVFGTSLYAHHQTLCGTSWW